MVTGKHPNLHHGNQKQGSATVRKVPTRNIVHETRKVAETGSKEEGDVQRPDDGNDGESAVHPRCADSARLQLQAAARPLLSQVSKMKKIAFLRVFYKSLWQ